MQNARQMVLSLQECTSLVRILLQDFSYWVLYQPAFLILYGNAHDIYSYKGSNLKPKPATLLDLVLDQCLHVYTELL